MKRWMLKLAVLLVLGAMVNVVVAWGCLYRSQTKPLLRALLGDEPFYLTHEPMSTLRYDFGVIRTWRTSQTMNVTWLFPPTYLSAAEYQNRLPHWSAFQNTNSLMSASEGFVSETGAGWPMYSVRGSETLAWDSNLRRSGVLDLPLRQPDGSAIEVVCLPIWPGFAINTVFYAGILYLGYKCFAAPGRIRRWRRIKRGLCPACAYPVGENNLCTECGQRVRGAAA